MDPGAVLLLLRQPAPDTFPFPEQLLHSPAPLQEALRFLREGPIGFADWSLPALQPIYRVSLHAAHAAWRPPRPLTCRPPRKPGPAACSPPLAGWCGAVSPEAVSACLTDPAHARAPASTQQRYWGLDQAGISRRLARRWGLPAWLTATLATLALPADRARALGASPVLHALVRLALERARDLGPDLGLSTPFGSEDEAALGGRSVVGRLIADGGPPAVEPPEKWQAPCATSLLPELLTAAAENRHLATSRGIATWSARPTRCTAFSKNCPRARRSACRWES